MEKATVRGFGDPQNPLLVSVRSGAPVSMPGMMDTVLNLGLNDATVCGLAESTRDERFARDSHRRFIQTFAPKATGNIATEDLVYLLHGMGYETGIDLDALIECAQWLSGQLGKELPGQVHKAGNFEPVAG